jgi:hypothetical protein
LRDAPVSLFTLKMNQADEGRAIAEVSNRLHKRFPEVEPATVDQVVSTYHHEFDGSPIRDFVPILVERQARDRLTRIPMQRRPDGPHGVTS